MGWIQLLAGVIALAREILKILQEKNDNKKDSAIQARELSKALRRAREEGKSDDIEKILRDLPVGTHNSDSDRLQDK